MSPRPSETPFDVRQIPFSLRGSWLDLSPIVGPHRHADDVHLVSHQTGMHAILRLTPERAGARVETVISATPSHLEWSDADGRIGAVFDGTDGIRLRGQGLDLRIDDAAGSLTPFTGTYLYSEPGTLAVVFTSYETGRRYRITPLTGRLVTQGDGALGSAARATVATGEMWELAIEEFTAGRDPYRTELSIDQLASHNAAAFDDYVSALAPWRSEAAPATSLACYVLWSATVRPLGFLGRESILMSKHWMDKVWSWDHAFNAIALATGLPSSALDQFFAPFDHQDATGAPPDSVTHSEVLYNFVKPPIHGWALARIRERLDQPLDRATLESLYEVLSRWTTYWLDYRRVPGHALPYYQHGNDSGWDNSTTFDRERVIESPDLAAFLVVQLDVLAGVATELGLPEAEAWAATGETLLDALLDELWDGEHFVARGAQSRSVSSTTSLLNLLPIVAAQRLPQQIRDRLTAQIRLHVTEYGPATEIPGTEHYEPDGYWRGPIWAPSAVLIQCGLRASGEHELADLISARFRALCERSGFAENFDAVTGEGLRDRAYTWTASAYLIFAAEAAAAAASLARSTQPPT